MGIPDEPEDWGFFYPIQAIEDFFWRWRRSGYTLTVTGSYEKDLEEYSLFWQDIRLYDRILNVQLAVVQNENKAS